MEQVDYVHQHTSQRQILNMFNHLDGQKELDLEEVASLSKFTDNITWVNFDITLNVSYV